MWMHLSPLFSMIKLEMLDRREYPVLAFQYSHCPKCNHRHLPDKPKEFWTIDFFIDELVNLLNHFELMSAADYGIRDGQRNK